MVCVVDDAQWLDMASSQVLAFVARRLVAESVALIFAVAACRTDEDELTGMAELAVVGLADDDARALLASVIAGPLDERVRDRIVAETRGNPLALLELPRGLTPAELAGGFGLPDAAGALEPDRGDVPEALDAPAAANAAPAAGRGGGADRRSAAWCGVRPASSASIWRRRGRRSRLI